MHEIDDQDATLARLIQDGFAPEFIKQSGDTGHRVWKIISRPIGNARYRAFLHFTLLCGACGTRIGGCSSEPCPWSPPGYVNRLRPLCGGCKASPETRA